MSTQHKQATSRERLQVPADQMTEPPADPVSRHRRADLPAHDKPDPGRLVTFGTHEQMPGQQRLSRPAALLDGLRELCPSPHPGRRGKHGLLTAAQAGRAGQTLTRARPFRRRAARTARPARVRMRSRNPCVFARRRLFGWNVRLLTRDSRYGSCHRPPPWGRLSACASLAGVTGPKNATRTPGSGQTGVRPPAGPRDGPPEVAASQLPGCLPAVTVRNTRCLPNASGIPALGCGQRSRARGSGILVIADFLQAGGE
jgi:hypothetical protein